MRVRKLMFFWWIRVGLLVVLGLGLNSCGHGGETARCSETGGIGLDFSSLPAGNLVMFTVDRVDGIRVYEKIEVLGTSLWCRGSQEVPPQSGNWKDAAVMLLFHRLPCSVCGITAEVHGHGPKARMVAAQKDGTTQTAVCPGDKRVLILNAGADNPFVYAILSGQEAEWLTFRLE